MTEPRPGARAAAALRWAAGCLAALTAALLPAATPALAAPPAGTIRWVVQHLPPHFSLKRGQPPRRIEELGSGEVEGFMRVLLARMPEYRHEFVEVGTGRFEALSRTGETLCSLLHVFTPERLDWLYFSDVYPTLVSREIHVIVRRDRLAMLGAASAPGGQLALADLLQRPELRPLLALDRAFGPQIDKLLAAQQVPRLSVGAQLSHRMLDMLRAGRMDYTLEYPAVVNDYLRSVGEPGALVALPVAEGISATHGSAACSRTPEGRRQIEAIDAAVRALARDPAREAWVRAWRGAVPAPADLKRLNAYMDERARGGPHIR